MIGQSMLSVLRGLVVSNLQQLGWAGNSGVSYLWFQTADHDSGSNFNRTPVHLGLPP